MWGIFLENIQSHVNQLPISEPDWAGVPQGHGEFVYGPHRAGEMFSGQYDKGFRQNAPLAMVEIFYAIKTQLKAPKAPWYKGGFHASYAIKTQ